MQLHIVGTNLQLTPAARDHIERRLRFALGRFGSVLSRVRLLLGDENAQRGGIDKLGRIEMRLNGGERIVVEGRERAVGPLVGRMAERAARAVARLLNRRQWKNRARGNRRGWPLASDD